MSSAVSVAGVLTARKCTSFPKVGNSLKTLKARPSILGKKILKVDFK